MVTMTHIEQVSSVHSIPLFSPLDREKKMYLPIDSVRSDSLSFLTAASDSKGCMLLLKSV